MYAIGLFNEPVLIVVPGAFVPSWLIGG